MLNSIENGQVSTNAFKAMLAGSLSCDFRWR